MSNAVNNAQVMARYSFWYSSIGTSDGERIVALINEIEMEELEPTQEVK